jgi:photosystem II stability/assembly factor-like uncharacterized protein
MQTRICSNSPIRHSVALIPVFSLILALAASGHYASAAVWPGMGPEGGYISAIAVDPHNSAILYAGSELGGLFKSTNSGQSWNAINNGVNMKWITALAIDPITSTTLYAGTIFGFLRSTNGGASWSTLNTQPSDSLVINPQNPAVLLNGCYKGIYRSTDSGASWNQVSAAPSTTTSYSLAIDPLNPATVYAGTSESGIIKSTDGGTNWNYSGLKTEYIRSLVIDPLTPNTLYAGTFSGVYKSTDGGVNWLLINKVTPIGLIRELAVDPINPANLYASSAYNSGVFKSTDGGTNWFATSFNAANGDVQALAFDSQNSSTIYIATNKGVFKSTNSGMVWNSANHNLIAAGIEALAIDPQNPSTLYTGIYFGGAAKSIDAGRSWHSLNLPISSMDTVNALLVDPQNPSIVYATTGSGLCKSDNGGESWGCPSSIVGIWALAFDPFDPSTLYGGTYDGQFIKFTHSGLEWSSYKATDATINSLAVDPLTPSTLYFGTASGALKSTNGGANWQSINSGLPSTTVVALAIDPISPATLYACTYNGIYKSTNAGVNWNTAGSLGNLSTYSVAISPITPTTLYVGASGGVYESTDSGSNWRYLSAGSSYPGFSTLAIDPKVPQRIFAGTNGSGVWTYLFRSSSIDISVADGGATTVETAGDGATRSGYAKALPNSGPTPYGTAVFSYKQNGVTVSEAGVPASPPTTHARIFIDYRSGVNAIPARTSSGTISVNTGISVTNIGLFPASATYILRDMNSKTIATGHGTIDAGHHFACFIDQLKNAAAPDFVLPTDFATSIQFASLDIESSSSLSVLAFRGTTNQRNEFLITTTPVADLAQSVSYDPIYFPHFADGGGYATSLILLNTSNRTEFGSLQILDDSGAPLPVTQVGGSPGSSFAYSIPAGGILRFQTDGSPADIKTGWIRLTPGAWNPTPAGSAVFSYNPADTMLSETGIPSAAATSHARIYVDLSQKHNTGLAIANVLDANASISIRAFQTNGVTPAGTSAGPISLSASGHAAAFAGSFVSGLAEGFTGVLDISSTTPFAALTLRSLVNEREDFLMTAFPIADANRAAPSPIVFPHIVNGGGYETQFILLSPSGASSTQLNLYTETGTPFEF